MAEIGFVDIKHEEHGFTSSVIESTLPAWESAGWTRADNGSEESDEEQSQQLQLEPRPQFPSSNQTSGDPDDDDEE